jgi:hypothetical protein
MVLDIVGSKDVPCAIFKLTKIFSHFLAGVKISNADVIEADIAAANGVIHVINNLF